VPIAIILAGPDGAGKTTFAREFLQLEANVIQFVNADLIAAGLSPFAPKTADIIAGRIMIERLDTLSSESLDLALETTLSGNWLVNHIQKWQAKGYLVELYYLTLPSPEIAVERVAKRVREGGHFIPEDVIHRRLSMLERKYKQIVDRWMVYDNGGVIPILLEDGQN
jgi:predicted ABC-type ATPase